MAESVHCPAPLQDAFGFGSQAPFTTEQFSDRVWLSSLSYFVETSGILLLFKDVQKLCI